MTVLAWEAVEELLQGVPECRAKDVLRMVAAGIRREEIADRLRLTVDDIDTLVERGRALVLTAESAAPVQALEQPRPAIRR